MKISSYYGRNPRKSVFTTTKIWSSSNTMMFPFHITNKQMSSTYSVVQTMWDMKLSLFLNINLFCVCVKSVGTNGEVWAHPPFQEPILTSTLFLGLLLLRSLYLVLQGRCSSLSPHPSLGLSVGALGLQSHATTSGFSCGFWRLNTEVRGFSPAIQILGIKFRPAGPYLLSHFHGLAFNNYQILHMSVILILSLSMH